LHGGYLSALGQKADVRGANGHVRFTPKSGHVQCTSSCLLWANSGHPSPRDPFPDCFRFCQRRHRIGSPQPAADQTAPPRMAGSVRCVRKPQVGQ
jgi:hypothetical protein